MALTQGNWVKTQANNFEVWECDVTATTAENDAYTKVIDFIDPTKPFTVHVNTAAATLDASALPVDIWGGWSSSGLTGDAGTVKWTSDDGMLVAADCIDDVKSTGISVRVIPNSGIANVQSTLVGVRGYVGVGPHPYYVINLDGASTLNAATCHFVVVQ